MIGFLTAITAKDGEMGVVYLPTATPNSGWVGVCRLRAWRGHSVQQAMSMVLSGGIVTPDE